MQVGEYELTVTDVTVIFMTLVALKRLIGWLRTGKVQEPRKYQTEPFEKRDMTLAEVKRLRHEEKKCLAVVNDKIYDLSASRDLYENNRDTFESENGCAAEEWEPICARKYPLVGRIVD